MSSRAQARRLLFVTGTAALALAATAAACKGKAKAETRRAGVENPFPMVKDEDRELCGRSLIELSETGERYTLSRFAEPLHFDRAGQTIDATAYATITLLDAGTAHAGKFAMKATYRKGYTGGPAGSATEHWVDVEDVRLLARLAPPKAPPGVRAIVPGEVVVRTIHEGELARLDDRYLVELPANVTGRFFITPSTDEYPFVVSVIRDGHPMTLSYKDFSYRFETGSGGLFQLRVASGGSAAREPDRYLSSMEWGDELAGSMHGVDINDTQWTERPGPR